MKRFISYILTLFAFMLTSCQPEELRGSGGEGDADICIKLSQHAFVGTKSAADGDVINNLHVWLVDSGDEVYKYATYSVSSTPDPEGEIMMGAENKSATVEFSNVPRGTYKIYIVANLPLVLDGLKAATSAGNLINAVLPNIVDGRPPFGDVDGMPLSTVIQASIGAGVNQLEGELVRVCGRVRITVKNNTADKRIFLQSVSLEAKNPVNGYLFHRADHGVPFGVGGFSNFDKFVLTDQPTTNYIAPGAEKTYIDQYLYETGLDGMGSLSFNIAGAVYNNAKNSVATEWKSGTVYKKDGNETTTYKADQNYIIRNANGIYLLYNNNNNLSLKLIDDIEEFLVSTNMNDNYLWKFSGASSPVSITNVGNNMYLKINAASSPSSILDSEFQTVQVGSSSNGLYLYNTYTSRSRTYYSQINRNNNNLRTTNTQTTPNTGANYSWLLTPVKKTEVNGYVLKDAAEKEFESDVKVQYLDKYGLPVILEHICRNEDINIRINIYYNPATAMMSFKVEPWVNADNDTTFD